MIVTDKGKKRVIITGSDTFNDYGVLQKKMNDFTFYFEDWVVCTRGKKHWDPGYGGYIGAELLAEKWAHSKKHLLMIFWPPDRKGKKEKERDLEIVQYARYMAVFIDGEMDEELEEFVSLAKFYGVKIKKVRV